jgi:hypothetical protein
MAVATASSPAMRAYSVEIAPHCSPMSFLINPAIARTPMSPADHSKSNNDKMQV